MSRIGKVSRKTKESDVSVEINLDGTGNVSIETGVPFYDHMLSQLGKHAAFDLKIKTIGDVVVDEHHTIEDTAISLGQAFKESLGDKSGIKRYGDATLPLDEVLVRAAVDLSGRPYLVHHETEIAPMIGSYDTTLTKHIWESFVNSSDITLHIKVLEGRNAHHVVEAQFKAVARALREAVSLDAKSVGIPSTKGVL
ncbi:MAG: imidazoleglycerol-phosphate dehydratase HisB [Actinomycetes bacterium]|jgi:imidazoleglycerol-phosphate dehydratase